MQLNYFFTDYKTLCLHLASHRSYLRVFFFKVAFIILLEEIKDVSNLFILLNLSIETLTFSAYLDRSFTVDINRWKIARIASFLSAPWRFPAGTANATYLSDLHKDKDEFYVNSHIYGPMRVNKKSLVLTNFVYSWQWILILINIYYSLISVSLCNFYFTS